MRTTTSDRLACERLAEATGWSVEGRSLDTGTDLGAMSSQKWLGVLGTMVDLMHSPGGLDMPYSEVWELCKYEPNRTVIAGRGESFTLPDVGWPSLVVAALLRQGHPDVPVGGVVIV